MQSRLLRYTIYDDYDKQGPHAAVVQLNEMGRDVERCHTFLQVFFRNTNGVVLAYDASFDNTINRVIADLDLIRRYTNAQNPKIFLLGYLPPNRESEVDVLDIHAFCIENGVCDLGIVSLSRLNDLSNAFSCASFRVLRSLFKSSVGQPCHCP